jgi:hypothetical protein
MITAGITAAVAAILTLFGIKPGAYLVGVAIGVKVAIVSVSVLFGARIMRRRAAAQVLPDATTPAKSPPKEPGSAG